MAAADKANANDLARDTAVTRLKAAPGWYTASLGPEWNFVTPSGGVLMTIAMRAMYETATTNEAPKTTPARRAASAAPAAGAGAPASGSRQIAPMLTTISMTMPTNTQP